MEIPTIPQQSDFQGNLALKSIEPLHIGDISSIAV
jgi:hypothetical protein